MDGQVKYPITPPVRKAIQKLQYLLEDHYSRLCDPECEGRCRVCPAQVIEEVIKELQSSHEEEP